MTVRGRRGKEKEMKRKEAKEGEWERDTGREKMRGTRQRAGERQRKMESGGQSERERARVRE